MDEPSNRNHRHRAQPCLWQLGVVLVCVLLPGCASSGLTGFPGALSRSRNLAALNRDEKREAAEAEHTFGDGSEEVAAANYELVNAEDAEVPTAAAGRSGHSLLQPGSRTKKSVPLPFPVGQTEVGDEPQQGSPEERSASPWQSNPPRSAAKSAAAGRARLTATTDPTSAGSTGQTRGNASIASSRAGAATENAENENTENRNTVTPTGLLQTAPAARTTDASPPTSDGLAPAIPSRSAGMRKVRRDADATGAAERKESETEKDPAPEPTPAVEPSMLDRFRNLYAPRSEDTAERQRKSTRRWTDPFGLLTEREELTEPADTESEVMEEQSNAAVADAPESGRSTATSPSSALDLCITELEEELRQWPGAREGRPARADEWRRRQTDLRMLYMIAGRTAESVRIIDALPAEEQEFWQAMMMATNHYRRKDESVPRAEQLAEVVSQVRTAARHLQPLAKLDLYRLQFCSRIDGFGNVTEFPTADFEPGQRLLLYAGIRNFRSERTAEGRYRTEFAAVIEFLREEDGEVLETIRLPEIPDECDEERTDYFQSFELTAPALEGVWYVRIQIRDQLSQQTAESQLKITIR